MKVNLAVSRYCTAGRNLDDVSRARCVIDSFRHIGCARHIESLIFWLVPARRSVEDFVYEPVLELDVECLIR